MGRRHSQKKRESKGSVVWNVLGIILCLVLIPVIVINVVLIVSNLKDPDHMPGVAGIRPTIVLSGSMEPAFYPGDVILIKDTDHPEALQVGDVVCYQYSGKATTHRVMQVLESEGKISYVTKGDNNNVEDRLAVEPDQIEGVWTGTRIPKLGNVLMFAQTSMGMLVLIICPLAALLAWDLLKRKRSGGKEKKRTEELEAELAALKAAQAEKKNPGDA